MIGPDILIIDGFNEKFSTADQSPWAVYESLKEAGVAPSRMLVRECDQNNDPNSATAVDFSGKRYVLLYSWGTLTAEQLTQLFSTLAPGTVVIIVLGVNDPLGIGGHNWAIPAGIIARCFQITPDQAFPVSQPIAGAPWIVIQDPSLTLAIADTSKTPQLNINCNDAEGVKDCWWIDEGGKIWNHTNAMNLPAILHAIVSFFLAIDTPPTTSTPAK
jgi:hypothetical protein